MASAPPVNRVVVATDRSTTADRAVRWATRLASASDAELLLVQVLRPEVGEGTALDQATAELGRFAAELAGPRGRARVVVDVDPARAIVAAAGEAQADVLVVGNVGMSGRKQFLLGNIPNQISHNARCTLVIVNTAQPEAAQPAAGWATTDGQAAADRELLGRAWRIGRVLAGAGLRSARGTGGSDGETRARAQRLRAALDELGPTFAKLGQILSTRPDLLPPAVVEELATLQDRVTPLSEAEVVSMMERELHVPWEDVFASIDPEPLAAGTIAQVHRATLEGGQKVVVKVQRPNAERDISQDLRLLELLAAKAGDRPGLRRAFDLPAMVEHLSTSLRRELDFRQEAGNLERMRAVLSPYPRLAVPRVYREYSTARLLVMEEVEGVPVLRAPPGSARGEAARQLLESYYCQVMEQGFFHADPHPGNMKWWNDRIYFLDLGMVGEVESSARELMLLLLLAFAHGDAAFLAEATLMLAGEDGRADEIDMPTFQAELGQLIARFRSLKLSEIQLGPLLQEVTEIALRHHVRVPAALALAGKAFAQMQLVVGQLDPDLDPFAVASAFVLKSTVRQLAGGLSPQGLFYGLHKTRQRLFRVVEAVEGAIGARPGENLQVRFRGTEGLESTIALAGRRVSLGLGACGALIGAGVAISAARTPRWIPSAMGGLGSVLAAGLLVDLGRRR
jgi:ubiquinone biosynthesis protein